MTIADERTGEAARGRDARLPDRLTNALRSFPREAVLPLALVAAIATAGAVLRFWDLGARAFHHDESLHAAYSWYLADGRGYEHDPLMHGPFLFHSTAAVFVLFGDGDFQARVVPALFGVVLIAMSWLFRDRMGSWGVVALAGLLAFSPSLLYFSRFIRNDIFIAVWTLGIVLAMWRYVDRRQPAYLVALAALLAFSFSTKETTFITAALFVLYFNLYAAWQLASQTTGGHEGQRWRRLLLAVAYAPFAWIAVAAWPIVQGLRERLQWTERTPAMDVLLVLGTFTLPQFAAGIQVPLEALGVDLSERYSAWFGLDPTLEARVGLVTVVWLLAATAAVGLRWNWRVWAISALVFYGIYFTLYTTFFTNMDGLASGIWGSLDYWLEQHDVRRGDQPWFYYGMLTPVYEFLPLVIALLAAIPLALRGNPFTRFVLFWTVGTFIGLSLAGEKMPWLTVHIALPIAVLAALGIDRGVAWALRVLRSPGRANAATFAGSSLAAGGVAVALLTALMVRQSLRASFDHDGDGAVPVEMLVYTQTSPELLAALDEVEEYARTAGQGRDTPILVDSTAGFSWPWAWYLRHYGAVSYADMSTGFEPPPGTLVLAAEGNTAALNQRDDLWRPAMTYVHRWWFPERYKDTDFGSFFDDITESSTWEQWWDYFTNRELQDPLGEVRGVLYLPVGESAQNREQAAARSPADD